jgi:hypothetical protein
MMVDNLMARWRRYEKEVFIWVMDGADQLFGYELLNGNKDPHISDKLPDQKS